MKAYTMAEVAETLRSRDRNPSRVRVRLLALAEERGEELTLFRESGLRSPWLIAQADLLRLFPGLDHPSTEVELLAERVGKLQRVVDRMQNRIFATERKTNARG